MTLAVLTQVAPAVPTVSGETMGDGGAVCSGEPMGCGDPMGYGHMQGTMPQHRRRRAGVACADVEGLVSQPVSGSVPKAPGPLLLSLGGLRPETSEPDGDDKCRWALVLGLLHGSGFRRRPYCVEGAGSLACARRGAHRQLPETWGEAREATTTTTTTCIDEGFEYVHARRLRTCAFGVPVLSFLGGRPGVAKQRPERTGDRRPNTDDGRWWRCQRSSPPVCDPRGSRPGLRPTSTNDIDLGARGSHRPACD